MINLNGEPSDQVVAQGNVRLVIRLTGDDGERERGVSWEGGYLASCVELGTGEVDAMLVGRGTGLEGGCIWCTVVLKLEKCDTISLI